MLGVSKISYSIEPFACNTLPIKKGISLHPFKLTFQEVFIRPNSLCNLYFQFLKQHLLALMDEKYQP